MSPSTVQAIRNAALIVFGLGSFIVVYVRPAIAYIRAWLYVRFFIRYEMAKCVGAEKVR